MASLTNLAEDIHAVCRLLVQAKHPVALTGAGMSAESSIPTFRPAQDGLWSRYRPEELATLQAWRRDPALVWGWYLWRMARVRDAAPNSGHRSLAAWAAAGGRGHADHHAECGRPARARR